MKTSDLEKNEEEFKLETSRLWYQFPFRRNYLELSIVRISFICVENLLEVHLELRYAVLETVCPDFLHPLTHELNNSVVDH